MMPEFEVTDKNTGRVYVITAPDVQQASAAWQKMMGGAPERPANDVMSGDEARAKAAGNTRGKMRPQDIEYAYDTAAARGDRGEQKAMARGMVERQRAESPVLSAIGQGLQQFVSGLPIVGAGADEAMAGVAAATGGDYQKALDYNRALSEDFSERNPWTAGGLNLAGGVAGGLGMAKAASPLLSGLGRAPALAASTAGSAAVGGADGFLRGEETLDNRIDNAKFGAALGGAVGVAAPVIGKGIDYGVNKAVDATNYVKNLRGIGLSKPSASVINRALDADAARGGAGAANIQAAGPQAMLADAGPSAAGVLDTTIQRGGPGARRAISAIEDRARSASGEVEGALDAALGKPVGVQTSETAIRKGTQAARNSAYERAYSRPIDYAKPEAVEIQDILTRVPKGAISRANELMRMEGAKSKQIMAKIAPDGSVSYETLPDVRQIDYITRAIRTLAEEADGKGALGGTTDFGRVYRSLATDVRDRLKTLVPEYAKALDTAADAIGRREALRAGEKLLSPTVAMDEAADTLRGMSKAELNEVKQAIRSRIGETLANVRRTMTDDDVTARQGMQAIRELSSDAAREKIALVIGDAEAKSLFARVDQAAKAFNLKAQTATNSRTFGRQAVAEGVKEEANGPLRQAVESGSPVRALKAVWQGTLGSGPAASAAREDKIYDEISRALTERRGGDALKLLQELQDVAQRTGAGQNLARTLATIGAGGLGGGAYQATSQQYRPRGQ